MHAREACTSKLLSMMPAVLVYDALRLGLGSIAANLKSNTEPESEWFTNLSESQYLREWPPGPQLISESLDRASGTLGHAI